MAAIDVTIEDGPPPQAERLLFHWVGRYELRLGIVGEEWLMASPLGGAFLVSEPQQTLRCFLERTDTGAGLDVLMRRVLPRVAMLFGATALHAAAAATDDGAVLLLGQSGAGKSTLAVSLAHSGWRILSDDIAILWNPAIPELSPTTTGVCVWQDSRRALALPDALCQPMVGYEGKVRYTPEDHQATAPAPLTTVVFLDRSADTHVPIVQQLSGAEVLGGIMRHRLRFNPAADPGQEARESFKRLSEMVRHTPGYRMSYPGNHAALPRVTETLRALIKR